MDSTQNNNLEQGSPYCSCGDVKYRKSMKVHESPKCCVHLRAMWEPGLQISATPRPPQLFLRQGALCLRPNTGAARPPAIPNQCGDPRPCKRTRNAITVPDMATGKFFSFSRIRNLISSELRIAKCEELCQTFLLP